VCIMLSLRSKGALSRRLFYYTSPPGNTTTPA
jgi:hypothetical protein